MVRKKGKVWNISDKIRLRPCGTNPAPNISSSTAPHLHQMWAELKTPNMVDNRDCTMKTQKDLLHCGAILSRATWKGVRTPEIIPGFCILWIWSYLVSRGKDEHNGKIYFVSIPAPTAPPAHTLHPLGWFPQHSQGNRWDSPERDKTNPLMYIGTWEIRFYRNWAELLFQMLLPSLSQFLWTGIFNLTFEGLQSPSGTTGHRQSLQPLLPGEPLPELGLKYY